MNKTEFFKELESTFIYELQNVSIYANSRYSGTAKYYSNNALETLLNETLSQLANDIEPNSTLTFEHLPSPLERPLLLQITILALKNVSADIMNKIDKVEMMLFETQEQAEEMSSAFTSLANVYQDSYNEEIQTIKNNAKKDTYIIHKPIVKEDEVLIVKVGSEERPATSQDINDVQTAFSQIAIDNKLAFVTHHLVNFSVVKTKDLPKEEIKEIPKEIPIETPTQINPITSLELKE